MSFSMSVGRTAAGGVLAFGALVLLACSDASSGGGGGGGGGGSGSGGTAGNGGASNTAGRSGGAGKDGNGALPGACGPWQGNPDYCVCATFQKGTKQTCSADDFVDGKTICLSGINTQQRCECRPFLCVQKGSYCQCSESYARTDKAVLASQGYAVVDSCTSTACYASKDGGYCECGEDPSSSLGVQVASCSFEAVLAAIGNDEGALYRAGTKCFADGTLE